MTGKVISCRDHGAGSNSCPQVYLRGKANYMNRMVMLTDFSSNAEQAMAVAMDIALRSGAEIFLVHFEYVGDAVAHVPGVHIAESDNGVDYRFSKQEMDRVSAESAITGISVHVMLVRDQGLEKVSDYVQKLNADLLVMGSHGRSGWRPLAGSMVNRVLRSVKAPVLIVPDRPRPKLPLHDFVFASTFRHDQTRALAATVNLARLFGARVHMVFLNLFSHLIREEIAREKVTQAISVYPDLNFTIQVVNTNDERWGLEVLAARLDAGVVVVSLEHQSVIGRLIDPPFAQKVLSNLSLPVLAVHSAED